MRYAFCVTTWSGSKLVETISYLPKGARCLVVDLSQHSWALAKGWNYGIDRLCNQEGYDVAIVLNDDVVLRPDTGDLLAWALLEGQYQQSWTDREMLVISARHAAPSDACTDVPDWDLLNAAEPKMQPGPDFAMFGITAKAFELVGPFDEEFGVWHEDRDYHHRIQLAGYEAGAYPAAWHFRNGTTRTDPERAAAGHGIFRRSRERFVEKWGGDCHHERFTRPFDPSSAVPNLGERLVSGEDISRIVDGA